MVAGWEFQDNSNAGSGQGLAGKHSQTFYDALKIVGLLQQLQPLRPPAYMLENSAMQHNFRHSQVRADNLTVCEALGKELCLDAVQFGARAHRVRNYWTNLADTTHMQIVLESFVRPLNLLVRDILEPNHIEREVTHADQPPFHRCNMPGSPWRRSPP
jgi:hypothetical protein